MRERYNLTPHSVATSFDDTSTTLTHVYTKRMEFPRPFAIRRFIRENHALTSHIRLSIPPRCYIHKCSSRTNEGCPSSRGRRGKTPPNNSNLSKSTHDPPRTSTSLTMTPAVQANLGKYPGVAEKFAPNPNYLTNFRTGVEIGRLPSWLRFI
jgi:hypothetical protein